MDETGMNRIVSLTTTPLIIFISSADTLWLKNQADLNHSLMVLLPFAGLFFITILIGGLLYLLSGRKPFFRYLLWGYYLLGPFFLFYNQIRRTPFPFLDSAAGTLLSVVVFLVVVVILARKAAPGSASYFFSMFGILLLIFEVYTFTVRYEPPAPRETGTAKTDSTGSRERGLPNIYHLLLDEFQTEKFIATLTPEVKGQLGGFVFFPNNTTLYGRTGMSVASIFLGRSYDPGTSQRDYQLSAFNSESSILAMLKKAGYSTHFYWNPLYRDMRYRLIDRANFYSKYAKAVGFRLLFPAFMKLWVYTNLPAWISRDVIGDEEAIHIKNRNLLPDSAVIVSYYSFLRFLDDEETLPASNRYTYIHLVISHFPEVLTSDCSFDPDLKRTTVIEQSECATSLMVRFIRRLKELKRFDDSLIIISADHGSWYTLKDGELVALPQDYYSLDWSWARSRTLLLIKPAGLSDDRELMISDAETTLLDIAPTIARSARLAMAEGFEGIPLVDPIPVSLKRKRHYHFYDKRNPNELTERMTRYIIEDGTIRLDGEIRVRPCRWGDQGEAVKTGLCRDRTR